MFDDDRWLSLLVAGEEALPIPSESAGAMTAIFESILSLDISPGDVVVLSAYEREGSERGMGSIMTVPEGP